MHVMQGCLPVVLMFDVYDTEESGLGTGQSPAHATVHVGQATVHVRQATPFTACLICQPVLCIRFHYVHVYEHLLHVQPVCVCTCTACMCVYMYSLYVCVHVQPVCVCTCTACMCVYMYSLYVCVPVQPVCVCTCTSVSMLQTCNSR